MGLFTPAEEIKGQLVDAFGYHVLSPTVVMKATSGSGDYASVTVVGLCGNGVWDGIERITWNGEVLDPSQYHFHNGFLPDDPQDSSNGGVQIPDDWAQGLGNFSGTAYVVVRLPNSAVGVENFEKLKVQARCKRVMDYDANGTELGYIFSDNPALVWLHIFHEVEKNPLWRIHFPSWVAWKEFCGEEIEWAGGERAGRPNWITTGSVETLIDGGLYAYGLGGGSATLPTTSIPAHGAGYIEFDAGASGYGQLITIGLTDNENGNLNAGTLNFTVSFHSGTDVTAAPINYHTNYSVGDRFRIESVPLTDGTTKIVFSRFGVEIGNSIIATPKNDLYFGATISNSNPNAQAELLRCTVRPEAGGSRYRTRFRAGVAFTDKTDATSARESCLYLSCTNIYDADGVIHFVLPEVQGSPLRPPVMNLNETHISDVKIYTLNDDQKVPRLTGVIRDIDTPEWKERSIDVSRDEAALIRGIEEGANTVVLGTTTEGQAKCVLSYQLRMTYDLDAFISFKASGETYPLTPSDIISLSIPSFGFGNIRCLVVSIEDSDPTQNADTRRFLVQVMPSGVYSDNDQTPLIPIITDTPPPVISAPPFAAQVILNVVTNPSVNGTVTSAIEGTVIFRSFANGYQRARIYVAPPNSGGTPFITPLTVDPNNPNFVYYPVNGVGVYTIYAVTENAAGRRINDNITAHTYAQATLGNLSAQLPPPTNLSALFSQDMVEYRWTPPTGGNAPLITKYALYKANSPTSANFVRSFAAPSSVGTEVIPITTPATTQVSRWLRSEDDNGNVSTLVAFSNPIALVNLPAVTGFGVTFDGYGTYTFTWTPLGAQYNVGQYQIATDANFTNIISRPASGNSTTYNVPNSVGRNYAFWIRAVDRLGNASPNSSSLFGSIAAPVAPTIAFDSGRIYPYNAILKLTPASGTNLISVLNTVVEISYDNFATTPTISYRLDGLPHEIDISGRTASQPTTYVRVRLEDYFGASSNSNIASVVFVLVGGDDVYPSTIRTDHLIVGGLSDNLVLNGSFEIDDPTTNTDRIADSWTLYGVSGASRVPLPAGDGQFVRLAGNSGVSCKVFSVLPNDQLAYRFRLRSITGTEGAVYIGFSDTLPPLGFLGDGTNNNPAPAPTQIEVIKPRFAPPSSWNSYEGTIEVPADYYWASIIFVGLDSSNANSVDVDDVVVKKPIGDAFIREIRAEKIIATQGDIGIILTDQITQRGFTPFEKGSAFTIDTVNDGVNIGQWSYDSATQTFSTNGSNGNWTSIFTDLPEKRIRRGRGYIEFILPQTNKQFRIGFTSNGAPSGTDLAYYFETGTGNTVVCKDSTTTSLSFNYSTNAVFRISIGTGGWVRFYLNGIHIYTSPLIAAAYPYYFAASHNSTTIGKIANPTLVQEGYGKGWRLNPQLGASLVEIEAAWQSKNNVIIRDNGGVEAVNSNGTWGYGACSNTFPIQWGDGLIQLDTSVGSAIGQYIALSQSGSATTTNPTTMDFAIVYLDGNQPYVSERGVNKFTFTQFADGDILSVAIEGGKIKYRLNRAVVYESTNNAYLTYDPLRRYSPSLRAHIGLQQSSDVSGGVKIAVETSGLGEFNDGITARGLDVGDSCATVAQIQRNGVWRGWDVRVPDIQNGTASFVDYHDVYCFWDVDKPRALVSFFLNVDDWQTNPRKNMGSVDHIRVRALDKFGRLVLPYGFMYFSWNGRGVAGQMILPRDEFCDPYHELVLGFELHNIYGYSQTFYWTPALWATAGNRSGSYSNFTLFPPRWKDRRYCPTNVKAVSTGSNTINVSFHPSEAQVGAAHTVYYRPYKSVGYLPDNDGWTSAGTTTNGTLTLTNLAPSTRYEFMAAAPNTTGDNDALLWGNLAQASTMSVNQSTSSSYPAPVNLVATPISSSAIDLTWTPNSTPTSTEVSRRVGTTGSWSVIAATYMGTQPFHDTGLTAGTTYQYRLRNNFVMSNMSDYSATASAATVGTATPANTPSNLSAVASGLGYNYSGRATWSANGGSNFTLQFTYEGAGWAAPQQRTGISTTTYTISQLAPETSYMVRVRAESPSQSGWSNEAVFTTRSEPEGGGCVVGETLVLRHNSTNGNYEPVKIIDIWRGDVLLSCDDYGNVMGTVVKNRHTETTKTLIHFSMKSGAGLSCSPSHPLITSFSDGQGVRADAVRVGDSLVTWNGTKFVLDEIDFLHIENLTLPVEVYTLSVSNDSHRFITNNILSHNISQK